MHQNIGFINCDGWHERGFSFARYINISSYAAMVLDIEVDPASGSIRMLIAFLAVDVGQVINPDGVNQIEGGIIQAFSWMLKEQVVFDRASISFRWTGQLIQF
jgi:nicotinate dehydrogenase subunit B